MKVLKSILPLLIVVIFSYWSIAPLFSSGFFTFHDDTQVVRVFEMKNALADGMFPVRWSENLGYGYGYPIFNFYAPLAYYVGGLFNLLGLDSLTATKLMIGVGMFLSGIFMYLLAREFWGRIGGIISALLYVYAPYHALNLYVRGAIAELWGYAFIPLVFLGLYKTFKNKKNIWTWVVITALSYAAIILSHNLTGMMVTPFIFAYALILFFISHKKKKKFSNFFLFAGLFLGIVLSAFYWLPVIYEMKYTNVLSVVGGGSDYKDHFVCLSQLWGGPWEFGGSVPGCLDGMSFKIGKLHILLALFSVSILFLRRSDKTNFFTVLLALVGMGVSIFLTLPFSQFVWDAITQMAFFQFPWRFLGMVSFFVAFLGGAIFILLPSAPRKIVGIVLIFLLIFVNAKLFVPAKIISVTAEDYTNRSSITWTTSKISDEYMPPNFSTPKNATQIPKEKISFTNPLAKLLSIQEKTQSIEATITTPQATTALIHTAYFPTWQTFLDNKSINFKKVDNGLQIIIPPGEHTLKAVFVQTPIEKIANTLSLTGILMLLLGIIYGRIHFYDRKKT